MAHMRYARHQRKAEIRNDRRVGRFYGGSARDPRAGTAPSGGVKSVAQVLAEIKAARDDQPRWMLGERPDEWARRTGV